MEDKVTQIAADYVGVIKDSLFKSYAEFLEYIDDYYEDDEAYEEDRETIFIGAYPIDRFSRLEEILSLNLITILASLYREAGYAAIEQLPEQAALSPIILDMLPLHNDVLTYRELLIKRLVDSTIEAFEIAVQNEIELEEAFHLATGLSGHLMDATIHYGGLLEDNDREALIRDLRDSDQDSLIRDTFDNNRYLTEDEIAALVASYQKNAVTYRASLIARTEAIRAANMGEYFTLYTAYREGKLSPNLKRFWITMDDDKVRRYHIPIPAMNANGVLIDDYFQTPLGPMRFPGDPNGVPANVINCRCRVVYQLPNSGSVISGFGYNTQNASRGLSLANNNLTSLLNWLY